MQVDLCCPHCGNCDTDIQEMTPENGVGLLRVDYVCNACDGSFSVVFRAIDKFETEADRLLRKESQ